MNKLNKIILKVLRENVGDNYANQREERFKGENTIQAIENLNRLDERNRETFLIEYYKETKRAITKEDLDKFLKMFIEFYNFE